MCFFRELLLDFYRTSNSSKPAQIIIFRCSIIHKSNAAYVRSYKIHFDYALDILQQLFTYIQFLLVSYLERLASQAISVDNIPFPFKWIFKLDIFHVCLTMLNHSLNSFTKVVYNSCWTCFGFLLLRDGTSESQFDQVLNDEMSQIIQVSLGQFKFFFLILSWK